MRPAIEFAPATPASEGTPEDPDRLPSPIRVFGRTLRRRLGPDAAFTLIETMLAVLLMAMLAAAVSLGFSGPLRAARARDAVDALAAFDAAARQAAVGSGSAVRLQFDMADDTVARYETADPVTPRVKMSLPSGYRIDQVRVGRQARSVGATPIDLSAHGWGRTYAVHVVGPSFDRWLCFAGLTGRMTEATDESSLPPSPPTAGYDAD